MRLNKNIYDDICIRKIINKIIIISLIALVISTLGCKSSSVGDKAGQYNFKQGVAELKLSLLDNAPPEKIYPNSNFKIVVEVDNPSAYDITDGRINIVGIDEKYFQVYPFEQNINFLEGRNLANPSGDKTFIEFDGTAGQLFQNAEEYTANFFLMAKYRSKVEFVDTVCISPNFYDVYDSGCKVEGKKSYSGQGAPLAVKEIEEIISPNADVEFRIMLKNVGSGKINSVTLGQARLGSEDISCQFTGDQGEKSVKFSGEKQEAVIICKHLLKGQNSYSTTLSIDFLYDYETKQQHKLRLIK